MPRIEPRILLLALSIVNLAGCGRQERKAELRASFIERTRVDLAALSLFIEKGDYSASTIPISHSRFSALAQAVIVDFRVHPELLLGVQDRSAHVEHVIDNLEYFWLRYELNPQCVFTNETDTLRLDRAGLLRDTNVWRAFDFDGDLRRYELGQQERVTSFESLLDQVQANHAMEYAGPRIDARIDALSNVDAYISWRLEHWDQILDAAERRHDHIFTGYIVFMLLLECRRDCNALLATFN